MTDPVSGKSTLAALALAVVLGGAVLLTLRAAGLTDTAGAESTPVRTPASASAGEELGAAGVAVGSEGPATSEASAGSSAGPAAMADGGADPTADAFPEPPEEGGPDIVDVDAFTLPYRDLEIAADVGGVVAVVEVEEGELVEEKQVLVRFKSDVLEAQVAYQRTRVASAAVQVHAEETRRQVAVREYERMAGLFEQEVIPERDYTQAELEKDLADWRVAAAKAALTASEAAAAMEEKRLEQTIVRAPIAGQILRIAKRPGEAVEVYNPILQMVSLDPLYVIANVPIETFGRIRPGMTAVLDVAHLKEPLACEVVVVDNVADVGSGLYRVKLTLPNPDGAVTAGALGKLRFELAD